MTLTDKQKNLVNAVLMERKYTPIIEKLGSGGEGDVFLVKDSRGQDRAIKCYPSDAHFKTLKCLQNYKHVVAPIDCFKAADNVYVYVMKKGRNPKTAGLPVKKWYRIFYLELRSLKQGFYTSG